MPKNNDWTRKEHILAFNLYCKIPFTKINENYPPIKELAKIIGRTNGSVAMKMANFARLDPALQARNVSGLSRGAKGEVEVWNEFNTNWNNLAYESELILAEYSGIPVEEHINIVEEQILVNGYDREAIVRLRVNQDFFRKSVLGSYNYKCCITGLAIPQLLVAGHIVPWAVDTENRTNPSNGLCMNALFDKAYDRGLITINTDYQIIISEEIIDNEHKNGTTFFSPFHSKKIIPPQKFFPKKEFLEYHLNTIFKKG